MATDKIQSAIRFQEDTLKKMTYIAKQNRRSFNAQMEFLAENCIKSYEKSHGKIVLEEKKI